MDLLLGLVLVAFLTAPIFAVLGFIVGNRREAGGQGALLGLLFGPLGVLVAFALDSRSRCGQCHGRLDGKPRVCPHCQAGITWPTSPPDSGTSPFGASRSDLENPAMIACPNCGLLVQHYAAGCPDCGIIFSKRQPASR